MELWCRSRVALDTEVVSSICALIWLTRASMSALLPAPLTMVVFSLSIDERDVLHLDAEISEIA
jgi:hypothetical protein